MKVLYITSTASFSGKTALCIGLGNRLRRDGFGIGYMKPVSTTARKLAGRIVDEDAQFIKQAFDLAEPLDTIAPIALSLVNTNQTWLLDTGCRSSGSITKKGDMDPERFERLNLLGFSWSRRGNKQPLSDKEDQIETPYPQRIRTDEQAWRVGLSVRLYS